MKIFVLAAGCLLAAGVPASAQIVRLSVTTGGVHGNDSHYSPSVSADGRFVAFDSTSSNLAPGDDDTLPDVFLRDRDTDADGVFDEPGAVSTICISATAPVATAMNRLPKITPDGRYVFFLSAPLITVPDTAGVWRLDRQSGTLARVADGGSLTGLYEVSADGNVVVINRQVHEIAEARITTVPDPYVPVHPFLPNGQLVYGPPSLSADGTRIAYFVGAWVVRSAPIENPRIYVFDRPSSSWSVVPVVDPIGVALSADARTAVLVTPASIRRQVLASGVETPVLAAADFLAASPDQRYVVTSQGQLRDVDLGVTTPLGFGPSGAAFSADGRWLIVASIPDLPGAVDTNGDSDIFAIDLAAFFDADADTMDDRWEALFGVTDPGADPDGDGQTNAQEEDAGTHPNGQVRRFLAEGATGTFFHTTIGLANPGAQAATAVLTFDKGDGTRVRRPVAVPALRSLSVDIGAVSGLEAADVSTTVESDRFLGIERGMTWGGGSAGLYGSHAETAAAAPSTTWFLAEGSTVLDFDLFYLLQNPQATATEATVRFLMPSGTTLTRTYDLPAGSRTTIYVNQIAGLGETDVSGDITASAPIVVERAMYRSLPGQPFGLGHGAMGVTAPATSWFLAEGATGSFFDLYVLIANPGSTDATVEARYAKPDGTVVTQSYTVRANSRFSVYVDALPGLAATSVATTLTSTNAVPIVAERAMYWPGGFFDYYEGHASAGSTSTALSWVVAGGENGGATAAQTFVLIANTDGRTGEATITLLPEIGNTAPPPPPAPLVMPLPANSRTTVPVAMSGRYGVLVTSTGASPVQLVVESAVYHTVGGVTWAAGSNALATPVP
jgi:hypothetical protein